MSFTMMPNVFRSRVQLLISDSSSVSSPPPSLSLYMFSIYLKQKYMDCIKHGKANRCYSWQKHKKNHRLLFYSSIFVYSRDLFSLSLFFFFFERNKKSFSFLSECFCDLLTQTVEKSINSENIHHSRSPSVKRLSF